MGCWRDIERILGHANDVVILTLEIAHSTARPRPRPYARHRHMGKYGKLWPEFFPLLKSLPEFLHRIKAPPYWVPPAMIGTTEHSRRAASLAMKPF